MPDFGLIYGSGGVRWRNALRDGTRQKKSAAQLLRRGSREPNMQRRGRACYGRRTSQQMRGDSELFLIDAKPTVETCER